MNWAPFNVVFLAGGRGERMGSAIPKQYLPILHKPLALYSFEVFAALPEVQEIVVICDPPYEKLFQNCIKSEKPHLQFARPGRRRQDSVFNGIQCFQHNPLICIHDAARPLIDSRMIRQVVKEANHWQAATLGVKVKSTIKRCDEAHMVVNTPDRSLLWEIQTPQVIRLDILKEGFAYAHAQQLTVTDDVALVELLGKPVKVVEGSYLNLKVTTPEDLIIMERLMEKHALL